MAGANIKIGASSSEFQTQMREVSRQLKLVSSECGLATEKAKLFGNTQEKLTATQKELTAKIQAQNNIMSVYKDRIVGINSEIEKEKNKQLQLSKQIEEVIRKKKESTKETGKNSEETKKLSEQLAKLKEEHAKSEKAIESSNKSLLDATSKMNNMEKSILNNKKALEDVNKQISNLSLDKLENGLEKVSQASNNVSNKLKPISTAIVGTGVASATAGINFENSMAKVMTIADETIVSYDDMKKSIIDLSNQTGISANEIANNVYDAISAGQSTGDAVNFVAESSKLAKAGFAEAGQSLDLLTTIMNSYGLEASEVNRVSDILINTQNLGKVTVAELSADMGKIIPTAKATGVNLEQVATGYTLMTSKGIKSAESTTYMNSMFNELSKSGTKVSDKLKEITGSSFQELISSGKSVGDVLSILDENAKANGKSLSDMFGSSEAAKAAMILVSGEGKEFNEVLSKMGDVTGATDKAFNTISDTSGNKLQKSLNETKNSAIKMGDTLSPVTDLVASGIGKVTNSLSGLSTEQMQTIAKIGGGIITLNLAVGAFSKLTGMLKGVVGAYKNLKTFGSQAVGTIKNLSSGAVNGAKAVGGFASKIGKGMTTAVVSGGKAIGSLALSLGKATLEFSKSAIQAGISASKFIAQKAAMIASAVATNTMAAAQAALNFVMNLNPITLIIIGITALVAAIVLLWNKCEWFRELCYSLFEGLKQAWDITIQFFKSCWDWFVGLWSAAVEGIKNVWQGICDFFKLIWDGVCKYFEIVWNAWKTAFEIVVNAIKTIWEGICNAIKFAWQVIVDFIKLIWQGWANIFQAVGNIIQGIWQGICNVIKTVWEGIVNTITFLWEGFKNIFKSVGDTISGIWDGITGAITSTWDWVVSSVKGAWDGIIQPFKNVVESIKNIWEGIKSMFKLPHFSITGNFSLIPPSIPKVSVDWYYQGGIFKTPTILGGIGVGDAFNGQGSNAEAIVPLGEMYTNIKGIVKSELGNNKEQVFVINNYMDSERISQVTYKKVNNKLALSVKGGR